jgi:hypothetical protein
MDFVAVGGKLYFTAITDETNRELFVIDTEGTPLGAALGSLAAVLSLQSIVRPRLVRKRVGLTPD